MNDPISLGNLNNIPELLDHVLSFVPPKQNVINTSVCKLWQHFASDQAKRGFINQFRKSVEEKAANFFAMVPTDLETICPDFAEIVKSKDRLSMSDVHDGLKAIPEKHEVCFAGCFVVDPDCPNTPLEKKEDISGIAFAEFHYAVPCKGSYGHIGEFWGEVPNPPATGKTVNYFPVELFNLTIEGEDKAVIGEKDSGVFCLPLKGRLIELTLTRDLAVILTRFRVIGQIGRDNAPMINLPKCAKEGHLWASELYIPKLHGFPIQIENEEIMLL